MFEGDLYRHRSTPEFKTTKFLRYLIVYQKKAIYHGRFKLTWLQTLTPIPKNVLTFAPSSSQRSGLIVVVESAFPTAQHPCSGDKHHLSGIISPAKRRSDPQYVRNLISRIKANPLYQIFQSGHVGLRTYVNISRVVIITGCFLYVNIIYMFIQKFALLSVGLASSSSSPSASRSV